MRLRKIRDILEYEISYLELNHSRRNSSPVTYEITDVVSLQDTIHQLDKLNLFNDLIEEIKAESFYSHKTETAIISNDEFTRIKTTAK